MTKERPDKHDREVAEIRVLIKTGMQMIVATQEDIRETRKDLRALAASQKRTEASLKAFIDQMRNVQ